MVSVLSQRFLPDKKWITGKSFGAISFDSAYIIFPSWKLENWVSFCISADTELKSYKTFVNEREVFTMANYDGAHKKRPGNIFLLNAFFKQSGFVYPIEASVTDVNIWRRVLDADQMKDWSQCTTMEGGDFVNWETSHVSAVGVETQDMEKTDICNSKQFVYMAFENKLSFPESKQFCSVLNGEIATTNNAESADKIKEAFLKIDGNIMQESLAVVRPHIP